MNIIILKLTKNNSRQIKYKFLLYFILLNPSINSFNNSILQIQIKKYKTLNYDKNLRIDNS